MGYQKTINLFENAPNQLSNLKQKTGSKYIMMTCVERMTPIIKLNLKIQS